MGIPESFPNHLEVTAEYKTGDSLIMLRCYDPKITNALNLMKNKNKFGYRKSYVERKVYNTSYIIIKDFYNKKKPCIDKYFKNVGKSKT